MSVTTDRTVDCFAHSKVEVPEDLYILGPNPKLHAAELAALAEELGYDVSDFGQMSILSQRDGDMRVVWCKKIIASVRAIKEFFMELTSHGMMHYHVGTDGKRSAKEIKEFNETKVEEVVSMPLQPIAGG